MKGAFRTLAMLIATATIATIAVSLMARYADPLIAKQREEALRRAIKTVLRGAQRFEVVDEAAKVYRGFDGDNREIGYAFVARGGGYQGVIRMMIGVTPDWDRLEGLVVLENVETPGLGARIDESWFRSQFDGMEIDRPIEYVLNRPPANPGEFQAITGATITSRAVRNILNDAIAKMRPVYGSDPG